MPLLRFAAPENFHRQAVSAARPLGWLALALFAAGGYGGLVLAPLDYQMGDSYRIMFIHAPAAWMSLFVYAVMAVGAACGLIWHFKLGDAIVRACAPLGAGFTACALVTGALWGKPTWGTFWVWDARLTSELVLLFLFLGVIALANAFDERRAAARAAAVLALVGVINLPIIHFSVEWWNTLHQGATVTKLSAPSLDTRMLIPLLTMFAAFKCYFLSALLRRTAMHVLENERGASWVKKYAAEVTGA